MQKAPVRVAEPRTGAPKGPPGAEELLVSVFLSDPHCIDRLEGRDLLKLGGLVALPMLMVMAQPDLGTSLTYVPVLAAGVFLQPY